MEFVLYAGIFLACAVILYLSVEWVVGGLTRLSRRLGIREFVLAFFVMAMASSIPNLFLGLTSAVRGFPELSLGDVFGNNVTAMTLAVAAGVFFSRQGFIEAHGRTIRWSLAFMSVAAILPIILLTNGSIDRVDGLILIGFFFIYVTWLLSRQSRFSKEYRKEIPSETKYKKVFEGMRKVFYDVIKVTAGILLLLLAATGIVFSASFFASYFGVPILIIGLLVTGLGNALPEVYFSIASARRGETALIMGNLVGSVIVPATLVLGLVALVHPIRIDGFEFLAGSRGFILAAATLFFIFGSTKSRIGRIEASILLLLYLAFVAWVIFFST